MMQKLLTDWDGKRSRDGLDKRRATVLGRNTSLWADILIKIRSIARGFIMLKPTKNIWRIIKEISRPTLQIANDKGVDQTARMRRLVCALLFAIKKSRGFSCTCPFDVEAKASWHPPGYVRASFVQVQINCLIDNYT